mgnify:CR=1 FL=1
MPQATHCIDTLLLTLVIETPRMVFVCPPATYRLDIFSLGCLVYRALTGDNTGTARADSPRIPAGLRAALQRMLKPVPTARPPAKALLRCKFARHKFVQTMSFLDNVAIKDDKEKQAFFRGLTPLLPTFPEEACRCVCIVVAIRACAVGMLWLCPPPSGLILRGGSSSTVVCAC